MLSSVLLVVGKPSLVTVIMRATTIQKINTINCFEMDTALPCRLAQSFNMRNKMNKFKPLLFALILTVLCSWSCATKSEQSELTVDQAIRIAAKEAARKNYDSTKADIEVLKVKKGIERGPIRMVALIRIFPPEMSKAVISKEYWVIYFYPKGSLEKAD